MDSAITSKPPNRSRSEGSYGSFGRSLLAMAMEPTAIIHEEQEHLAERRAQLFWAVQNQLAGIEAKLLPRVPATQQLSDWYLTELIGEGTWSRIFRAQPLATGQTQGGDYAIKVSRFAAAEKSREAELSRSYLKREAQVVSQLQHRSLVSVLSARLDVTPSYLVLPYLTGKSLSFLLEVDRCETKVSQLPLPKAIWTLRQIAEGLVALHGAGWIHGDIKSANIMVSPKGQATLLDFGFARRSGTKECETNQRATFSPIYAAPEHFRTNEQLTSAADIYSLGVVLFEAACGKTPFTSDRWEDLALAHLRDNAPDIRQFNSQIPLRLAQLLRNMLAKHPPRRPTAQELVRSFIELEITTLGEW